MSIKPGSYTVEVTQQDINLGCTEDSFCCPIALAVCRLFEVDPNEQIVEVGTKIHFNNSMSCFISHDPIFGFIKRFDSGHHVEPFTFNLTIIPYELETEGPS